MFVSSAIASTLAWTAAYAATAAASHRLSPSYRALKGPAARAGWDSRVTSTLHAIFIVALAIVGGGQLLAAGGRPPHFGADTLLTLRATPLSRAALGMSAGYFVADLALVLRHPGLGGGAMVAHHVAALAALAVGGSRDEGHAYTLALMLAEATTPLVNARFFLDATGRRGHWAYLVNGLALTAAWAVVRVAGFGLFFAHLVAHWEDVRAVSPACRALLATVPALFGCLNLWWFSLLLRGAAKVLRGGSGGGGQRVVSAAPADRAAALPCADAEEEEAEEVGVPAVGTTAARRSPSPPLLKRRVSFSDSPPVRAPLTRARAGVPKPSALRNGEEGGVAAPRWWAAGLAGMPARVAAWAG